MAQMYLNISIICFFLSAACFIVALIIFFSLHILEAIRQIRGQSQIKWVIAHNDRSPISLKENSLEKYEEEMPTTSVNGEVRDSSLVEYYEDETELEGDGETAVLAEEPTQLSEVETEDIFPRNHEFKIIESILYIHTDEEI